MILRTCHFILSYHVSHTMSSHRVTSCHIVSHCCHINTVCQIYGTCQIDHIMSLCELYWWAWIILISCQPMARCIHSKLQNLRHGCIYNPFSTHRISWSSSRLKAWYDNRSTIRRHAAMISQYSHWQPLACKCWNVQLSISCGLPGKKFRLVDSKWRQALCGPVSRISMDISHVVSTCKISRYMSSFVQICSDANSELTIADARLPLDHGAASSEWSCSASLFNGGALVKRGVTKCYKMLQRIQRFHFFDFQIWSFR